MIRSPKPERTVKTPSLVFIYGPPPAAGKLTVAETLAKRTGHKVFHNHAVASGLLGGQRLRMADSVREPEGYLGGDRRVPTC
jgi:hypothetical protein